MIMNSVEYPQAGLQITWASTLGQRLSDERDETGLRLITPSGDEGKVIADIYGREHEVLDRMQAELARLLGKQIASAPLYEYFAVRDIAVAAGKEVMQGFVESSVEFEEYLGVPFQPGTVPALVGTSRYLDGWKA